MIVVENENELALYHHGTLGMHWGVRRYQNADGSLTAAGRKRYLKNKKFRDKYLAEQKKRKEAEAKAKETAKQRHDRLMKTTDPKELLKHVDELSTEEIRERINRIDTERKLAALIQNEPSKFEKSMAKVNKALNKAQKFADSPVGKAAIKELKKQLGVGQTDVDYDALLKGVHGLTNQSVKEYAERAKNEKEMRENIEKIQKMLSDEEKRAAEERAKAKAEKEAARRKRLARLGLGTTS